MWRAFRKKIVVCFVTIWYFLRPFGIFYDHLVFFTTIWYFLRPFGIFYDHLVYFSYFGTLSEEKSGSIGLRGAVSSTKVRSQRFETFVFLVYLNLDTLAHFINGP
jgi:hypothetical protein